MREHEHEHDESADRPQKGTGPHDPERMPHLLKAAAAGRTDVLGPSGVGSLQRVAGNSAVGSMLAAEREERSSVHDVVSSGGGQPLDTDTRGDMESRLGADFSDVRVHTDGAAHESAKDVGARAYTVGNNVVFQRDAYDPASQEGRTMLAHELTHVMQQRSGPVEGTETPGGIRVSDPSDRFEQEAVANAERAMSDPAPAPAPGPAPASEPAASAPAAAPVQRQAEGEDEEPADVQGAFVQRAEAAGAESEEEEAPPV